jgi:hypothetical protein
MSSWKRWPPEQKGYVVKSFQRKKGEEIERLKEITLMNVKCIQRGEGAQENPAVGDKESELLYTNREEIYFI